MTHSSTDAAPLGDAAMAAGALNASTMRLLNLFFILNAADTPLSTTRIISDADMGYGSGNEASDKKKFQRDREQLAQHGIAITEVKMEGSAGNEESWWQIDRVRTHTQPGSISPDDASIVLAAIDETFELHANNLERWPLQRAYLKLLDAAGEHQVSEAASSSDAYSTQMQGIWNAVAAKRAAHFTYRDGAGVLKQHVVSVYGTFTRNRISYFTGFDQEANDIRTFRTDRVISSTRPPKGTPTYEIPAEFDLRRHQFLPFDFSSEPETDTVFSFPATMSTPEIERITNRRGTLVYPNMASGSPSDLSSETASGCTDAPERNPETAILWQIGVRDLDAAAGWALEHASRGMRPRSPQALIDAWRARIDRALGAHGLEPSADHAANAASSGTDTPVPARMRAWPSSAASLSADGAEMNASPAGTCAKPSSTASPSAGMAEANTSPASASPTDTASTLSPACRGDDGHVPNRYRNDPVPKRHTAASASADNTGASPSPTGDSPTGVAESSSSTGAPSPWRTRPQPSRPQSAYRNDPVPSRNGRHAETNPSPNCAPQQRSLTARASLDAALNILARLSTAPGQRVALDELASMLSLTPEQTERIIAGLMELADSVSGARIVLSIEDGMVRLSGDAARMQPLRLAPDEAIALHSALTRYQLNDDVWQRLQHNLMPAGTDEGARIDLRTSDDALFGRFWPRLCEALQDGVRIEILYRSQDAPVARRRTVDAGFIELADEGAYLTAWDIQRDAQRRYRLDRIEDLSFTPDSAVRHPFRRTSLQDSLHRQGERVTLLFESVDQARQTGWAGLELKRAQQRREGVMIPAYITSRAWLFDQLLAAGGSIRLLDARDMCKELQVHVAGLKL